MSFAWKEVKNNLVLVTLLVALCSLLVLTAVLLVQSGVTSAVENKTEIALEDSGGENSALNQVDDSGQDKPVVFGEEHKIYKTTDAEPPDYLLYATTTNPPKSVSEYDLYIGEDQKNNLKLLHYKKQHYQATTTYPVYRIYPGSISTEDIIADYKAATGSDVFPLWFGNQPDQVDNFETNFLTDNLILENNDRIELPPWLIVPSSCFIYIPRDNCSFEITAENPYGIPASILTKETGPYIWSDFLTPYAIYLTNDSKIVIRWIFGDAGAISNVITLWDPRQNTHTKVSMVSGFYGEQFKLSLGGVEKNYVISHNPLNSSTSPILKQNPFRGWTMYDEPLLENCYDISFYPTDLADGTAPWLLEYTYGCYFGYDPTKKMIQGLSAWYELDPRTETVKALSGVMPK